MTERRYRNTRRATSRTIIAVTAACACVAGFGGTTAATTTVAPHPSSKTFECDRGTICLWNRPNYRGELTEHDLRDTNPGDCVTLDHPGPSSLANRSDRPLSVFADKHCGKQRRRATYPGGGTFVPNMAFAITAVKLGKSS